MDDSFFTISRPAKGEFRDRGSKFIAHAFPVGTEEEISEKLEMVKKDHAKARHHCYAYRLGMDNNTFRANDDGEPSGTAGRPILGQIDSFGLTNVMVVVVRYFGGTLLGTSGLINAYRQSSSAALNEAVVIEKIIEDRIRISFNYGQMGEVMNAVKKLNLNINKQYFKETAYIEISIRKSETQKELLKLKSLLAKVSVEEAGTLETLEGIEFYRI